MRKSGRPVPDLQPPDRHDGMPGKALVTVGQHVEALRRWVREQVLKVVLLVRLDAEINNSLTGFVVHVERSHRD
jgi:hypothetical protein